MIQLDRSETQPSFFAFVKLFIALFAVSCAPIFTRLSETELGANATIFNRMLLFALCFGLGQAIWRGIASSQTEAKAPEPFSQQQWILLPLVGLFSAITLVLWAISLEYTTVAKSMLLNNLTPVFTSLGGWLLMGKRFDNKFLLGMAIALAGALALGMEDLHSAEGNLIGDIYALLSAVFLGSYFLMVEQLRSRFSATTILLWRCAIGSILLFPLVLAVEDQLFPTTWIAWVGVIGMGLVSEGFGQRLLADSMKKFSAGFVSIFLLLEPIASAMLAWVIFAEQLSPMTWLGFVVILTGIYLAQSSSAATTADTETAQKIGPEIEEAI